MLHRFFFLGIPAFYKSLIYLTKVGLPVEKLAPTLLKHLRLKLPVDPHFQNLPFSVMNYALATKQELQKWVGVTHENLSTNIC